MPYRRPYGLKAACFKRLFLSEDGVAFAVDSYRCSRNVCRFRCTCAEEDFVGVVVGFWHVTEVEFVFGADFEDFESFGDEVGGELPEFFEAAVAIEDGRDVVGRVVGCNSEIVGHISFSLNRSRRV